MSMASMRSNSSKSEGQIGLEIEVTSIPRLFDAALILESAGSPFNPKRKNPVIRRSYTYTHKKNGRNYQTYFVVAESAGRVDPEFGLQSPLADKVSEHSLRGRASTDVAWKEEMEN